METGSKPNEVWLEQHTLTDISTRDLTTINLVVTDTVSWKMKFVDQDTQLMFSNERDSVCQFVILPCNLHANISPHEWWTQNTCTKQSTACVMIRRHCHEVGNAR
jgi:hypothetical protein